MLLMLAIGQRLDAKAAAAKAAIAQAYKMLRENLQLKQNAEFTKRLKALEDAQAAYIRARPDMEASPVAIASVQSVGNPAAALIALLIAAAGAKALQSATKTAMRNVAEENRTLNGLNEALRRLRDFVEALKPAAQAAGATVLATAASAELGRLLGLKGLDWTPYAPITTTAIQTAIGKLLLKFPHRCPDLERAYKSRLGTVRGGTSRLGSSRLIPAWHAFIDAALALVKCLLSGSSGSPPGAPAAG
jgi:hypothetical protein